MRGWTRSNASGLFEIEEGSPEGAESGAFFSVRQAEVGLTSAECSHCFHAWERSGNRIDHSNLLFLYYFNYFVPMFPLFPSKNRGFVKAFF